MLRGFDKAILENQLNTCCVDARFEYANGDFMGAIIDGTGIYLQETGLQILEAETGVENTKGISISSDVRVDFNGKGLFFDDPVTEANGVVRLVNVGNVNGAAPDPSSLVMQGTGKLYLNGNLVTGRPDLDPLQLNDVIGNFTTSNDDFQPTIQLTGSGLDQVDKIIYEWTDPLGNTDTPVWDQSNNFGGGRYKVADNGNSATISPVLVANGDPEGVYEWTVTFVAGGQQITRSFEVDYDRVQVPQPDKSLPPDVGSPLPDTATTSSASDLNSQQLDSSPADGAVEFELKLPEPGQTNVLPNTADSTPLVTMDPDSSNPWLATGNSARIVSGGIEYREIKRYVADIDLSARQRDDLWAGRMGDERAAQLGMPYAILSDAVYYDDDVGTNVAGWELVATWKDVLRKAWGSNGVENVIGSIADTGFYAAVYRKDGELVLVFRGSDSWGDYLGTNIPQIFAGPERYTQYGFALDLADKVSKQFGTLESGLTLTGHSLGGGLAQYVAAVRRNKNMRAITFNAAGVNTHRDGSNLPSGLDNVVNMRVLGDPVSGFANVFTPTKNLGAGGPYTYFSEKSYVNPLEYHGRKVVVNTLYQQAADPYYKTLLGDVTDVAKNFEGVMVVGKSLKKGVIVESKAVQEGAVAIGKGAITGGKVIQKGVIAAGKGAIAGGKVIQKGVITAGEAAIAGGKGIQKRVNEVITGIGSLADSHDQTQN